MISLYTESSGFIRAVAQGVRKPGAKLAGHLEPLTEVEILVVPTQAGWRLTGAIAEDQFKKLNADIERKRLALGAAALLELISYPEPDLVIWEIFSSLLLFLNESNGENDILPRARLWFLSRLLSALGYRLSEEKDRTRSSHVGELIIQCEERPIEYVVEMEGAWEELEGEIADAVGHHLGVRLSPQKIHVLS
jgi:recombinational DNA repair protein (RecF pathway)